MNLEQNFDQNWIEAVIERFFPVKSPSGDIASTEATPDNKPDNDTNISS